jgi:type I restriction enzyme S subunit
MAGDGAGAGRVFHHAYGKYAVHQRVYRLANFENVNTDYLYYYLSSTFSREMDRGSAQSTVPSVRLPMLKDFMITLPPLNEQQEIAKYLDSKCADIDALIALRQEKIDTLKEYKKSLIFEYVTGKKQVV